MSNAAPNISPEGSIVFFLSDRLEPALQRANAISSSGSVGAVYSNLELLESFLWLHLGVSVGYFPQPLARRVTYEYAVPILKAYDAILETRRSDTWLAQPMRNILSEEFSGRAPLLNIPETPNAPQLLNLPITFQNVFLLSNRFAQDAPVARIIASISLATALMWQHQVADEGPGSFSLDDDQDFQLSEKGVIWSQQGFFEMVEYMRAVPQLQDDALYSFEKRAEHKEPSPSPETINRERDTLGRFFEQVKQVQQWRLNFGYPEPRERFLQIARNVTESLLKSDPSTETTQEVVARVQMDVSDLLHYWGAPRSKRASA